MKQIKHNFQKKTRVSFWFLFILFALFLFYLSLAFAKVQAQAQNTTKIIVVPPKQELTLEPGSTERLRFRFYNESDNQIAADLKIVDFLVVNNEGSPEFLEGYSTDKAARFAASTWANLPYKNITIPPKDKVEVIITINVPKNALPGGHYFAVILEPTSGISKSKASLEASQSISPRVASLTNITIPGNYTKQATITKLFAQKFFEYGPIKVEANIKNTGQIHIRPQAFFQLTDLFGRPIDTEILKEVNIFPYAERIYKGSLGPKLMFGRYQISLTATFGEGKVTAGKIYVWVIPWKLITIAVLTIIILWIILKRILYGPKHKVLELEQKLKKEESEIEKLKKMLQKREE